MYEDVKEQFSKVIQYSQGIDEPKLDKLFKTWYENKKDFINLFGGLIYEYPEEVAFPLDERDRQLKIADFCSVLTENFHAEELAEFVCENSDTFFDNVVSYPYGNIPKGAKLLKSFKHFVDNKTILRAIQDMASAIIQHDGMLTGKLCFSVHPLDYLSSSQNNYGWRTCHCLDDDRRAGNLSYMTDKHTFLIYVKSKDDDYIPLFGDVKWNSKKWRVLGHASDYIFFAGRQYPYKAKAALDKALEVYNLLLLQWNQRNIAAEVSFPEKKYFTPFDDTYIDSYSRNCFSEHKLDPDLLSHKYLIYHKELVPIEGVIQKGDYALNFNDLLESSVYKYPFYALSGPYDRHNIHEVIFEPMFIGGPVWCLECEHELIAEAEFMRCDKCQLEYGDADGEIIIPCECCGAHIFLDDAYIEEETGDRLCGHCAENECFTCAECEGIFYNSRRNFSPEHEDWLCERCYEEENYG